LQLYSVSEQFQTQGKGLLKFHNNKNKTSPNLQIFKFHCNTYLLPHKITTSFTKPKLLYTYKNCPVGTEVCTAQTGYSKQSRNRRESSLYNPKSFITFQVVESHSKSWQQPSTVSTRCRPGEKFTSRNSIQNADKLSYAPPWERRGLVRVHYPSKFSKPNTRTSNQKNNNNYKNLKKIKFHQLNH
jgi:hypothetical protein